MIELFWWQLANQLLSANANRYESVRYQIENEQIQI
jgi:hypothetical protein